MSGIHEADYGRVSVYHALNEAGELLETIELGDAGEVREWAVMVAKLHHQRVIVVNRQDRFTKDWHFFCRIGPLSAAE